jgi:hypothetical protein
MDDTLAERIAYHESGHCIACITFAVPVISATVVYRPLVRRGRLRAALGVEVVATICLSGWETEIAHCGPPPRGDDGDRFDFEMAERHLRQHVGPLRLAMEFERCRASARALVRTPWAQRAIPKLAEALQRYGTLDGERISDVLLG